MQFSEAITRTFHIAQRLYKDTQDQGVRKWWPELQPGFDTTGDSYYTINSGSQWLLPGSGASNITVTDAPPTKLEPRISIAMPVAELDLGFLEATIVSATKGPHILAADFQLNMYYWEPSQAPFIYSKPWTIELPSSDVVDALTDWTISRLATTDYAARILGSLSVKIKKALKPFKVRLVFRCGTATAKGQWMIAAVRCETILTRGKLALPPAERSSDVAQRICAGSDEGFVLLEP